MKTTTIILFILCGFTNCRSQVNKPEEIVSSDENKNLQNSIRVEIHARVDTTKQEIKELVALWSNYLNSKPDQVSDSPYWNEAEKKISLDVDLSRQLLYQFPSDQLLRYFKPKILSIEKEGNNYCIKTIYWAEGLEEEYSKSNPWAIQKIYAVNENNQWRLKNALPIITESWKKKTFGKIEFIYPSNHSFNDALAAKAMKFCEELSREFLFPDWKPFQFYIAPNSEELGRLLNFDFFYAGYTTGITLTEKRLLLSGLNSEYYPHEFVHLIVPKYDRHKIIEEGFATWKGGQDGKSFEESAKVLANALAKQSGIPFMDVVDKKWGFEYNGFYTTGAILCNTAFKKGGVKLVSELLKIPNDTDNLVNNLSKLFKIEPGNFDEFWRNETLSFKSK